MLKVGLSKLSDSPGTSAVSSVDKLGVAASTSPAVPDQDILHKQQVVERGDLSPAISALTVLSLSGGGFRVQADP